MVEVKVFTKSYCPFCHRTLDLLNELKVNFKNIEVSNGNKEWETLKEKTGHTTVPMIFIDNNFIGGNDDLMELNSSGKLQNLLK